MGLHGNTTVMSSETAIKLRPLAAGPLSRISILQHIPGNLVDAPGGRAMSPAIGHEFKHLPRDRYSAVAARATIIDRRCGDRVENLCSSDAMGRQEV